MNVNKDKKKCLGHGIDQSNYLKNMKCITFNHTNKIVTLSFDNSIRTGKHSKTIYRD